MRRRFSAISSTLLIGWILLPVPALAGRPLSTEDADTAGKGAAQIEIGLDHAKQEGGDRETTLTTVFTYGLSDRLDVVLQLPVLFLRPVEGKRQGGIGDIEIRGKFRLLDEGPVRPALAVLAALTLPTGSERLGLGSGATDGGILLAGSKGFGPMTAHLNLGYRFVGASGQDDVFRWGVAASLKLAEALVLVGEVVGETNSDPGAKDDPMALRTGLTYALRQNLMLDGAVSLGLTRASPDYVLTVGVTARFE